MRTVVSSTAGQQRLGDRDGRPQPRPDVVVIPRDVGHLFTKIDDHIDYLMVRMIRQGDAD
jgi:hypothetical protein